MANYLARLRTPFFINETSSVAAESADITISINSVDRYIISKDTNANHSVSFEVSELIKDYLDPTWDGVFPYSATTLSSLTVNAVISVAFYTNNKVVRAANTLAGNPDTPVQSITPHNLYGFDAYSEFQDGVNHQLSSGSMLQSATIMYLPDGHTGYIPVESSNAVSYFTVANSVADGTVVNPVSGINVTIKRICEPVFDIIQVLFINQFGAIQEFHFNKKNTVNLGTTQSNYDSMLLSSNTYSTTDHQKYVYNKQAKETITMNTGYVDEGQFETIKQLMLSEQVWAKIGTQVHPMNVNTNSLTKKTKINDKLVDYSIDMEFAYDVVNSVR